MLVGLDIRVSTLSMFISSETLLMMSETVFTLVVEGTGPTLCPVRAE